MSQFIMSPTVNGSHVDISESVCPIPKLPYSRSVCFSGLANGEPFYHTESEQLAANQVLSASKFYACAPHGGNCREAVHQSSEQLLQPSVIGSAQTGYDATATTKAPERPSKDSMTIHWQCYANKYNTLLNTTKGILSKLVYQLPDLPVPDIMVLYGYAFGMLKPETSFSVLL
ncbi:hypothetical protein N7509_008206 [Penicillium cosmopolitanum]|uniref:Uncharacterized protein n=1 Tax=Penicillium cosmopolitanum TaxID=1131564 RepID=A0A9W9VM59_9EURO|nr:uncharacterized protein N7509_008206 [Penicillium cosmopolitanum]KAJ5385665.1 hypothetical protein N7509_008206 [Penicillium cosmopolitanum]